MQSLRKRLSFRKKKEHVPESSKPHQWQEDEKKVREGSCSFQVRYLGYIEVFDSRGMHICEEAVKTLKSQCKGKYQRATLYVSGDALRVVDEISKSMIVDQTIEKVSFCAPDRNHDKGFAYICRDGTTRRWMCHGFLAVKESGERLSHAVGCAFAICLEKKQKREKETGVTVAYNQSCTTFERTGSFRQTTLTERIIDPQSAIVADPVPVRSASNPYAVQRPHATVNLLERQGSFRGFEKLQEVSSPFKRTLSLRVGDLPSTLQRQNAISESPTKVTNGAVGQAITEVGPEQEDSISQMCQELTHGLSALTSEDPFSMAPKAAVSGSRYPLTHQASLPTRPLTHQAVLARQQTLPASQTILSVNPVKNNPWASTATLTAHSQVTTATVSNPFASPDSSFSSSSQSSGHQRLQQQPDSSTGGGGRWQQTNQKKAEAAPNNPAVSTTSIVTSSLNPWPTSASSAALPSAQGPGMDPFDVAWAAKSLNKSNSSTLNGPQGVKQFEVKL